MVQFIGRFCGGPGLLLAVLLLGACSTARVGPEMRKLHNAVLVGPVLRIGGQTGEKPEGAVVHTVTGKAYSTRTQTGGHRAQTTMRQNDSLSARIKQASDGKADRLAVVKEIRGVVQHHVSLCAVSHESVSVNVDIWDSKAKPSDVRLLSDLEAERKTK